MFKKKPLAFMIKQRQLVHLHVANSISRGMSSLANNLKLKL